MVNKNWIWITVGIAIILIGIFFLPKLGLFSAIGDTCYSEISCPIRIVTPNFCRGNSIYDLIEYYVCSGGICINETFTRESFWRNCTLEGKICYGESPNAICVYCRSNIDCGQDGDTGHPNFCKNSNVYSEFIIYTCNSPSTRDSYCTNITSDYMIHNCTSQGKICEYGFCEVPSGCNTPADTNCNNIVDRTELGSFITKWINNQVTRTELGLAIQAWVGG